MRARDAKGYQHASAAGVAWANGGLRAPCREVLLEMNGEDSDRALDAILGASLCPTAQPRRVQAMQGTRSQDPALQQRQQQHHHHHRHHPNHMQKQQQQQQPDKHVMLRRQRAALLNASHGSTSIGNALSPLPAAQAILPAAAARTPGNFLDDQKGRQPFKRKLEQSPERPFSKGSEDVKQLQCHLQWRRHVLGSGRVPPQTASHPAPAVTREAWWKQLDANLQRAASEAAAHSARPAPAQRPSAEQQPEGDSGEVPDDISEDEGEGCENLGRPQLLQTSMQVCDPYPDLTWSDLCRRFECASTTLPTPPPFFLLGAGSSVCICGMALTTPAYRACHKYAQLLQTCQPLRGPSSFLGAI